MKTQRPSLSLHHDTQTTQRFMSDPNATFLVSFPRTGSHWLRMLMELYFDRPTLTRVFYWPDRTDYLLLHSHDLELMLMRLNVIYLYREPIATVYSQLCFHRESTTSLDRIHHWSELYGRHLDRWLHQDRWTSKKTIVSYNRMRVNLCSEFAKICAHFGESLHLSRLNAAATRVTPMEVRAKVPDDPRVISTSAFYQAQREKFREEFGDFVWKALLDRRPHLKIDFPS